MQKIKKLLQKLKFKKLDDLEYLQLNKFKKFIYRLRKFFRGIPIAIWRFIKKIGRFFKKLGLKIKDLVMDIINTFFKGSWKTKVSYAIMGFGNLSRGQIAKGLLFLIFEGVFIVYMITSGGYWLGMMKTLGEATQYKVYNEVYDTYDLIPGDNSVKILLYGLLTILFIVAFIYTWRLNVKQCKLCDEIEAKGKKVRTNKEDLQSLLDDNFHKTLLALPVVGVIAFTIIPIIYMVIVAFTNYDGAHDGYSNLFTWVGMDNFNELIGFKDSAGGNLTLAFGEILGWTLIWAIFATFSNYFLGMFVAIMINKKGIKLKKMWRGILVLTIAVPQFISLMYVAKMFSVNGVVNGFLIKLHIIDENSTINFLNDVDRPNLARIMVILINIWIGIPYLMLIATGVLMNIPQDLYESAMIDGANVWQQYTRITLPYMLFVTGPYLLTSFIGNINNFNVIFLLTGGNPNNPDLLTSGGSAGSTDLLITWLFKITTGATANYKLASVIGIMIFLVVSIISLIVYNLMPSNRNEEDFS